MLGKFQNIYQLHSQIKQNELTHIRYKTKGCMPKELMSYEQVMLDNMSERRKSVLSKMTELYQPLEHNIYKERLIKEKIASSTSPRRKSLEPIKEFEINSPTILKPTTPKKLSSNEKKHLISL